MTSHFDDFVGAYIDAALVLSQDDEEERLNLTYTRSDIAPDAMKQIISDCERFIAFNHSLLTIATQRDGYSWAQAGMDFWLTRNGHGAGFWDRDMLENGEPGEIGGIGSLLSESVRGQTADLYVGGDDRLYITGAWNPPLRADDGMSL
jgi:hypothetical protein